MIGDGFVFLFIDLPLLRKSSKATFFFKLKNYNKQYPILYIEFVKIKLPPYQRLKQTIELWNSLHTKQPTDTYRATNTAKKEIIHTLSTYFDIIRCCNSSKVAEEKHQNSLNKYSSHGPCVDLTGKRTHAIIYLHTSRGFKHYFFY